MKITSLPTLFAVLFVAYPGCVSVARAADPAADRTGIVSAASFPQQDSSLPLNSSEATSLLQSKSSTRNADVSFDRTTGIVTVNVPLQALKEAAPATLRRENFAVYENGVRQAQASVEVEHVPLSLGILLEYGGRLQTLNQALEEEAGGALPQLASELSAEDKVAFWKYGDKLDELAPFTQGRAELDRAFAALKTPPFSELNFYDAFEEALARMKTQTGRRALVILSSGRDTFSRAGLAEALQAARTSDTPVYVVNLATLLRRHGLVPSDGAYGRIDWSGAEAALRSLAEASGGAMYSPVSTFDFAGIYDDVMESLRVRYVVRYPTAAHNGPDPRLVRVEVTGADSAAPVGTADRHSTQSALAAFEGSYVASDPVMRTEQSLFLPDLGLSGRNLLLPGFFPEIGSRQ